MLRLRKAGAAEAAGGTRGPAPGAAATASEVQKRPQSSRGQDSQRADSGGFGRSGGAGLLRGGPRHPQR